MKTRKLLSALGVAVGLALGSGPAAAGVTWHFPTTSFEDQDLDFVFIDAGGDGALSTGDVLVATFEVLQTFGPTTGPTNIAPDELTGVAAIQATVTNLDGGLVANDVSFSPYSGGLDAILALGGAAALPGGLGAAGGPAMTALYLDSTPNFEVLGPTSCGGVGEGRNNCIADASDGTLFQVDGIGNAADPDPDEAWFALNAAGLSYSTVLAGDSGTSFAVFNFALSTYFRGPGHIATDETMDCSAFAIFGLCAAGNGLVDVLGSGSVLGGAGLPASIVATGGVARSDFDYTKQPIPEPGSLALMAAALLGLGASLRRRRM